MRDQKEYYHHFIKYYPEKDYIYKKCKWCYVETGLVTYHEIITKKLWIEYGFNKKPFEDGWFHCLRCGASFREKKEFK